MAHEMETQRLDGAIPWLELQRPTAEPARDLGNPGGGPFEIETWSESCAHCGSRDSFLDEMIVDDAGTRKFVCSDTDYCQERQQEQEQ